MRRYQSSNPRQMTARFPGTCSQCGAPVRKGAEMVYEASNRTVLCMADSCGPQRLRDIAAADFDEKMYAAAYGPSY